MMSIDHISLPGTISGRLKKFQEVQILTSWLNSIAPYFPLCVFDGDRARKSENGGFGCAVCG